MGYFKNLEIELQAINDDELREIVAWDKAHQHKLSAQERWSILTDEVKLKRAGVVCERAEPSSTETRFGSCCVAGAYRVPA
jgi:hypothetical protein